VDDVGGSGIDARKHFGYSVPLEARAMKKFFRVIYGQYKLIQVCCYLDRLIEAAIRAEDWKQLNDLLDAANIILDAKDSL
jgi:hypothetical protein